MKYFLLLTNHKHKSNIIFLVALLFVFSVYFYKFLVSNSIYYPGSDESFQIRAAYNIVNKLYYSIDESWNMIIKKSNVVSDYVNSRHYSYLSAWPIGLSAIIALLNSFGFSLIFSSLAVKLFVIVSSCFLLHKIANYFIVFKIHLLIFNLLIFNLIFIYSSFGTSDLFVLVIFLSIVKNFLLNKNINSILLSIYSFLLLIIKYSSLPIVASIFSLLLIYKNKLNNKYTTLLVACSSFCTFAIIIILNYFLSGEKFSTFNMFSTKEYFNWNFQWLYSPFKAIFIDSFILPRIFLRNLDNSYSYIYIFFISFIFICILLYLNLLNYLKKFILFFLISLFINVFFLFLTSILFIPASSEWTPLLEGRYYLHNSVLIVLFFTIFYDYLIVNKNNIFNLLLVTLLSLGTFYSSDYLIKEYNKDLNIRDKINLHINSILDNKKESRIIFFLDPEFYNLFTFELINYEVHSDLFFLNKHEFKEITDVIIICHSSLNKDHLKDVNRCSPYNLNIYKTIPKILYQEIKIDNAYIYILKFNYL